LTRRDWRQEIRPALVSKLYIMITRGLDLVQLPLCVRPVAGLHQLKHLKMAGKVYFSVDLSTVLSRTWIREPTSAIYAQVEKKCVVRKLL
jgi:hypothetical protein